MGFGDKLKGLKDQAQQAVAENKDKIQGAVQVVGEAANTKTHGKYAAKIMKVGEKVEAGVDKFAEGAAPADAAAPAGPTTPAPTGTPAAAPAEAPPAAPDPGAGIEGDAPHAESSDAPIAHEPDKPVTPSAADTAHSGFPDFE